MVGVVHDLRRLAIEVQVCFFRVLHSMNHPEVSRVVDLPLAPSLHRLIYVYIKLIPPLVLYFSIANV